jgi:NTP pyrophosphatase (non-canonical NTP hydrolase)
MKKLQSDYNDMVAALSKEGKDILKTLDPKKCDLIHMGIGVVGEAGELIDAVKNHAIYNKEADRKNVVEELGDLEFYMQGIRKNMGITRKETLKANMEKLLTGDKARYKLGKYTDEQATNRADKG